MVSLFIILIVITCVVLAFFVLIQNPKGGGLAGSFGGLGNQMMGAKQSTDVVEKGTWYASAALLILVLASFVLAPKVNNSASEKTRSEKVNTPVPVQQAPAPASGPAAAPANAQPAAPANAPAPATPPPANQ